MNIPLSLSLSLKVLESKVLRIFGLKREGIRGERRDLRDEKLHNSYSSHNIFRPI
jgi:hypothetical protein